MTIIQIQIVTALVLSNWGGHLQLGKKLKDVYSNTKSDRACHFEKGKIPSVRREIAGRIFKYE